MGNFFGHKFTTDLFYEFSEYYRVYNVDLYLKGNRSTSLYIGINYRFPLTLTRPPFNFSKAFLDRSGSKFIVVRNYVYLSIYI